MQPADDGKMQAAYMLSGATPLRVQTVVLLVLRNCYCYRLHQLCIVAYIWLVVL